MKRSRMIILEEVTLEFCREAEEGNEGKSLPKMREMIDLFADEVVGLKNPER